MIAIAKSVKALGNRVIIVIPSGGEICDLLEESGIEYYVVPFKMWINIGKGNRKLIGLLKTLINYHQAKKLVKTLAIDTESVALVHTNSIITNFGLIIARCLNVPHIQHIREFGKKDFDMCFEDGETNALKKVLKHSKAVVCISKEVETYYSQYNSENKLKLIYNGVSIQPNTHIDKKVTCAQNKVKIVLVGRYSSEKGQSDAIQAIKVLVDKGIHNIQLDLFGKGPDEELMRSQILEMGLQDYVFLKGYKSDNDLSEYDIALMCSKCEAFGRVTIEYMLNQLPVIGAAVGGTLEIIENGVTGFLYQANSIEDLAQKIEQLYMDGSQRAKMGEAGLRRANECFSEKSYLENIHKLYMSVIGG